MTNAHRINPTDSTTERRLGRFHDWRGGVDFPGAPGTESGIDPPGDPFDPLHDDPSFMGDPPWDEYFEDCPPDVYDAEMPLDDPSIDSIFDELDDPDTYV